MACCRCCCCCCHSFVQTGYMLGQAHLKIGCMLQAIGKAKVSTLSELEDALVQLPDGVKVAIRYFVLGDEHRERVSVIDMDRVWSTMKVRS